MGKADYWVSKFGLEYPADWVFRLLDLKWCIDLVVVHLGS